MKHVKENHPQASYIFIIACCVFQNGLIFQYLENLLYVKRDTRWRSWSSHCATRLQVAGSISDGVIGIFR